MEWITITIRKAYGFIGAVDIVSVRDGMITRNIIVNTGDDEHGQQIIQAVTHLDDVKIVNVSDRVILMHLGSKIEVASKASVKMCDDLSMAYTPGVARIYTPFMKTRKRPLR